MMTEDMIVEENTSIPEGTADSVQSSNMIVEEEEEPESELDNLWKVVNKDPRDFTSWTYLLDYVEKGDEIENARKAFDQFLYRYPFCYGYWKKYAELEKRHHDLERCIEVYERGVKAIPMSVDLWTAYLDTALDIYQTSEDFEWTIKSIYERAIDCAGLEFRSDKLWEHFISWTSNNGRLSDATKIYDQLLRTATQMYYQNWENFKKHVEDNETQSIIPPEELEHWKNRILGVQKPVLASDQSIKSIVKTENLDDKKENKTTVSIADVNSTEITSNISNETNTDSETKHDENDIEMDTETNSVVINASISGKNSNITDDNQSNDISKENEVVGPKGDCEKRVEETDTNAEGDNEQIAEEEKVMVHECSAIVNKTEITDVAESIDNSSNVPNSSFDKENAKDPIEDVKAKDENVLDEDIPVKESKLEEDQSNGFIQISEQVKAVETSITNEVKDDPDESVTTSDEATQSANANAKESDVEETELTISDWSKIKIKFIEDREQIYQKTYEQITKRWYFEEKIRRPYFHVKPLEKSQLVNWREYLDMEIAENDFQRVKSLFERCLIACALYEEFWIRYANYLESNGRSDDARRVWENACSVHLPHRPELHWRWAMFEEIQGNNKAAVDVITRGCRECPGDVKLAIRRLSLLRRSRTDSVESVRAEYESTIEKFASENIACASVISLKYSRFLDREKGDREQAERVLREAIARDETNERLYMQLIDLNYRQPEFDWKTCDRVLSWIVGLTSLPLRLRLRFCQRRHEMLEEASDDIQAINSSLRYYEEMQREMETANELEADTMAATAEVGGTSHSEVIESEPPAKRARSTNVSSTDAQGYSYDTSYQYASSGTVASGDPHADSSHIDPTYSHQSHSGSNPQAYAAAAAAAAANAAYPNYTGGNPSWDSYYNSYYGYYAGYYGASGGDQGDWQGQSMTG